MQRLDISTQPGRSDQPGTETLALSASIVGFAIPDAPAAAPAARRRQRVTEGGPVSDREWAQTNVGRGVVAALAVSVVIALWTLVHAIRIAPVPEIAAPQFAASGALTANAAASSVDVGVAVEKDPFAPDRTAPATGYRAPGE